MPVYRLHDGLVFPPPEAAEDGLLAVGGDLSVERLLLAYSQGIFPWYSEEEPPLWWSPDPRMIFYPESMYPSHRLWRTLRSGRFRMTADTAFSAVIRACADTPRQDQNGTWILPEMVEAYERLHQAGFAHSIECWEADQLVGGLYGVSLGSAFFGESMFSHRTDASKAAFFTLGGLCRAWNFSLVDGQVHNPHLVRLGGREISRRSFLKKLGEAMAHPTRQGPWNLRDITFPDALKPPQRTHEIP